jgi:uncharacterized protein (TIGR00106 family)
MKVLVDFNLITIGTDLSVFRCIADCNKILLKYGLNIQSHALGTNVEGEWEDIALALEECHQYLHAKGIKQIFSSLKVTSQMDKEQYMRKK